MPDSIVIIKNIYLNRLIDGDTIYRVQKYSIIPEGKSYYLDKTRITNSKVVRLIAELARKDNADRSLTKFGIDTAWIKNHPSELLKLYSNKEGFAWNYQQKNYIFKNLIVIKYYQDELVHYFSEGCCYSMHESYSNEFIVKVFKGDSMTQEIKSRKYVWGYKQPWATSTNDSIYNFQIENAIDDLLAVSKKTKAPISGKKMLKHFVDNIVNSRMSDLYVLSAYSYKKEIDELKTDFDILSFNEVQGRGRYIWNEPATMRIRLRNKYMLDNVNLVFLASKTGETIYTRDSLKRDYRDYINRIQSITFIADYLKNNPSSKLDIYYFNNKGINDYNVQSINKNPIDWKRYDDYKKILEEMEKRGINIAGGSKEAIKTSQQVYCGCNYRFSKNFIEKAIFFEIKDANNFSSIWFLLPDNRVLLYIMDNLTALNYKRSDFGDTQEYGLIYPCALFDRNGQKLVR